MQGFVRRLSTGAGVGLAVAALAALAVIPVSATDPVDPDLNLHTYADGITEFTFGNEPQPVRNPKKGCLIASVSETLIRLGSTEPQSKPGYIRGIGLKTGSANGTPCSQVDEDDAGALVLESALEDWESMELDLELKQNAKILITVSNAATSESFLLLSGASIDPDIPPPSTSFPYEATVTSDSATVSVSESEAYPAVNCANPSDSGPDSGPNDNCRLIVLPEQTFDRVTITALVGAVSLEGGADFVAWDPVGQAAGDYDSIFIYVTEICHGDTVSDESGPVFGSFTRLSEGPCKRYHLDVSEEDGGSVTFNPRGTEVATFRGVLRFAAQAIGVDNSLALLEYDPDGVFPFNEMTMPVCEGPTFDADGNVTSATIPGDPGEHTWCLVRVTATANAYGNLAPTYEIYGTGDPIFRVR